MANSFNDAELKIMELQIKRLVSDRKSDKETYAEIHKDHESRIRKLEYHYARASGLLIAVSVVIQVVLHFLPR